MGLEERPLSRPLTNPKPFEYVTPSRSAMSAVSVDATYVRPLWKRGPGVRGKLPLPSKLHDQAAIGQRQYVGFAAQNAHLDMADHVGQDDLPLVNLEGYGGIAG